VCSLAILCNAEKAKKPTLEPDFSGPDVRENAVTAGNGRSVAAGHVGDVHAVGGAGWTGNNPSKYS
jgi:hypothetical protein